MIGGLKIFMFTSHMSMEDSKMSILPGRQVDYCVFLGGYMLFFPVHPGKFTVFEPEQKFTLCLKSGKSFEPKPPFVSGSTR